MHPILRSAGYSLFILSASCGVGAQEARPTPIAMTVPGSPLCEAQRLNGSPASVSNGPWRMPLLAPAASTPH